MSLNGLEAAEVIGAYQSALEEGGGWFLLKYISRDEVGLLGRGSGGLGDVQEAVSAYDEQSPLYGFIQYRRRKVILKYVPEGTSRLLQARVSVQFQSVTEKLSPHDTIFAFTKPSELQESALSSACSLHTATASTKSSNDSLPPRSLAGITEDASETRAEDAEERRGAVDFDRGSLPRKVSGESQTRSEEVNGGASADLTLSRSASVNTQRSPQRSRTTSNIDKALPPTPEDLEQQTSQKTASTPILAYGDREAGPGVEGRTSSQSARPSPRDLYDAYGCKQKIKYGPRPSIDSGGRLDNMDRSNEFRPVSTLPAGLRMPTRKCAQPSKPRPGQVRPPSQQAQRAFPGSVSSQETLRAASLTPIHIPDSKGSGVSNGLLTPAKTPAETKSLKITPEKRRLMKALQLRQKQLALQQPTQGLLVEEGPAQPQYSKPVIDDSTLAAIGDTSNLEVDSDLVHSVVKDLSKEESGNIEASPVSLPETSEGPSTQASSITDGEDFAAQKEQDRDAAGKLLDSNNIPSNNLDEDSDSRLPEAQGIAVEQDYEEVSRPLRASVTDGLRNATILDEPAKLDVNEAHETPIIQQEAQNENEHTGLVADAHNVAVISPLEVEEEPSPAKLGKDRPYCSAGTSASLAVLIMAEEQSVPTKSTGSERLASEAREAIAANSKYTSHLETLTTKSSLNRQAVQPNILPEVAVVSCKLAISKSGAAATQHDARSQPEAVPEGPAPPLQAVSTPFRNVTPEEIPLPPMDEEEEMSLCSHENSVRDSRILQQPTEAEREPTMSDSQEEKLRATLFPTSDMASGHRHLRRHGVVNPPKRVSSPDQSDDHFLSDDSFMEELKCATVQEAKPISVSRSPVKPAFSGSESEQRLADATRTSRCVSSPLNHSGTDEEIFASSRLPTSSSSRSFSASQSLRPDDLEVPPIPKKIGVSSGISQRIKALEQLSGRPTSPQSGAPPNTSQFITLRKISVRTPSGVSDQNSNLNSKSRPATVLSSPLPSPEIVRPKSLKNLHQANCSRPESVSVTATIVRDVGPKSSDIPTNFSNARAVELHQSPLVVEHQKPRSRPLSPLKPPRPRYARYSSARSGSTSSTDQKLDITQTVRRDSSASLRSRSSRASEVELPPRSLSDSSLMSGLSSLDDIKEEKKDSKRSRLIKRMSNISSISRRSIAHALSPNFKEAPIMERQEPIAEIASTAVDVGDVNVQFPDTLLWKRRRMIVDEQGVLILSASDSDNNSKVITKRYPLSEFRPPYIPDQDRQELPNSVVLDLRDGSTLQCACEHLQGQASVLQILRQAHSLYQKQ